MIIVAAKGSLTEEQKAKLEEKDLIVIETNDPSSVKILSAIDSMTGDALFMSALEAVVDASSMTVPATFARNLLNRLKEKSKKP